MSDKSVFAQNLVKARKFKGLTQEQAATYAKITRSSWGSYEEDRAFPSAEGLIAIAECLNVEDDLYGFINNPEFFDDKGRRKNVRRQSLIERKYHLLKPGIRIAVDALMNIANPKLL
jgi:transcriptional regulator with XRE-family HTH domain